MPLSVCLPEGGGRGTRNVIHTIAHTSEGGRRGVTTEEGGKEGKGLYS